MNHVRFITLDASRADQARRTVPATISTEFPVNRGGYREVLLHGSENIDLSRAPLPLIESHNGSTLNIGTVEGLQVAGRKLRGTVRFGNSARASEVWADVTDGIVRNVSVGYTIDDYAEDDDTLRATRWTPHEVSLVAVPADPSAGLNRSNPPTFSSTHAMNELNDGQPAADAGEYLSRSQKRALHAPSPADLAQQSERDRVAEITATADQLTKYPGVREVAAECIRNGATFDQFRARALEAVTTQPLRGASVPVNGMEGHAFHRAGRPERDYSIARALRAMVDPRSADAGYEIEVSQEIAHRTGRKARGLYVPMGQLSERALTVAGAPSLVGTQQLGSSFIDALRARSVVMNLGPMLLSGLTEDVSVPRLATTSTAYWIAGDGSDGLTDSTPAFAAVTLSPKTVGALVLLSRKMILQSDPAAEGLIQNDLAKVIATELDRAAIQGSGASNQPTGILNTAGINSATFAGAAPTFAEIVAMESSLLTANVDAAGAAYVTTPALAGVMKTTLKAEYAAEMIWQAANQPGIGVVNGLRALSTSNAPAGKVILGNWSDFVMGFWGGLDLQVNPYENFAQGTVSVRCFASVDFGVRHAPSFAVYSTP